MAGQNTKPATTSAKHHYVRTIFASLFGFIAVGLIITSILVVWLDRTLTDTNQYVKTVGPLVSQPAIQDFVVDKAASGLLENKEAPIHDVAAQLLGEQAVIGKTDDQLRAEITPIVKESLQSVVKSQAFASLWKQTNHDLHSQIITQLNANADTIHLDLHPVITGVIDQLGTTRLGFVKDKLELKDDVGKVALHGKQLNTVRSVYDYFKKAMLAIILLTAISLGLCIWISVHHLKTLRRVALATGIYAAVLASILSATSLFKFGNMDPEQQKMVVALVNGITHDLRLSLVVVAVVCITGAVGSKIYAVLRAKK